MAFIRGRGAILGFSVITVAFIGLPQLSEASFFSAFTRLFLAAQSEIEDAFPPFLPATTASEVTPALEASNRPPGGEGAAGDRRSSMAVVQDNALLAPLNPIGTMPTSVGAGQIFIYTIRSGDTLSSIADAFNVSVNTIVWANNLPNARSVAVGTELVILPVSGVRHEVKKGDTLDGIAKRYRASITEILQFNGFASDEKLAVGSTLIIPNGESPQAVPVTPRSGGVQLTNLPRFDGYYLRPIVAGRRSRGIHGFNGVDLADSCGLPVLASADGAVIVARTSGWNGGYGRYLVLSHPNGTQTLYAHLRELITSAGQPVRRGQVVATIGSSGNSTGCHVHFEVRGARNPF